MLNKLSLYLQVNHCILPSVVYVSEIWMLTAEMIQKLQTVQQRMERLFWGIQEWTEGDKLIRDQTKVTNVIWCIKIQKWRWTGNLARRVDNRQAKILVTWRWRDVQRSQKRQIEMEVHECESYNMGWIYFALNSHKWSLFGEAFISSGSYDSSSW